MTTVYNAKRRTRWLNRLRRTLSAYRHVPRALQQVDTVNFPFQDYFLRCVSFCSCCCLFVEAGLYFTIAKKLLILCVRVYLCPCRCRNQVNPPAYIAASNDRYNLATVFPDMESTVGRSVVHVLHEWPEIPSSLDASQMSALKQAIVCLSVRLCCVVLCVLLGRGVVFMRLFAHALPV